MKPLRFIYEEAQRHYFWEAPFRGDLNGKVCYEKVVCVGVKKFCSS